MGGAGTFSLHNRTQGGYKLLNDEYLRYVQMVNNIDDNGNMPEMTATIQVKTLYQNLTYT